MFIKFNFFTDIMYFIDRDTSIQASPSFNKLVSEIYCILVLKLQKC